MNQLIQSGLMRLSKTPEKKNAYVFLTAILLTLIMACSEKIHTVSDFEKDNALLSKYIEKCDNGDANKDGINCVNAYKAKMNLGVNSIKFNSTF